MSNSSRPRGRAPWEVLWPGLAYRAVILALALVAIGLLFEQLVDLLLLLMITVIIALPVAASATWLQRFRVPRGLGALVSLLFGLGLVVLVLVLIIPPFVHQVGMFVSQLPATTRRIEHSINHTFGFAPGTISRDVQRFADRYTQHPTKLLGPLSSIGIGVAGGVGAIVVMLITALYIAINPSPLVRGLLRLVVPEQRDNALRIMERIRAAWMGWLRGVALDMLVLGGLLFVGMTIIGLPFAVGFAVFSALMTVIPNYGSVISAIPPILYGLTRSFREGVLVAVVYVVVNQIEGNVALPLIMGRSVSMHPALVAIGVLIVGSLFGVLGLFLSIPLISLALILIEEIWIRPQEAREAELMAAP